MLGHENPFRVRSSQQVYENPWIRVVEHQVTLPSGKPGIYGVVHFKNRAVGVIPYENGYIWLVGQYRFPLSLYSWEIPEGGSPQDEELEETARRELKEETGLVADKLHPVLRMHLSNSSTDELGVVFLALGLKEGAAEPEESEKLSVRKVSLDEVYQKVVSGEITDALTVAGILRLMLMRTQGEMELR